MLFRNSGGSLVKQDFQEGVTSQSTSQIFRLTFLHVCAGSQCRYLATSKIPISLKDAKAKGFTACKICYPPE